jgi:hypothetical protein
VRERASEASAMRCYGEGARKKRACIGGRERSEFAKRCYC